MGDGIAKFDYSQVAGIPEVKLRADLLEDRLKISGSKARALEIGIGAGDITLLLARYFDELVCVDIDEDNCRFVSKQIKEYGLPMPHFICSPIEDVAHDLGCFDHIILLGVLEHLESPVEVLSMLRRNIQKGGSCHICVNLANSIHRWLGVEMGYISHTEQLSEQDYALGHKRVYTRSVLHQHIRQSGWRVSFEMPFYLKPLPTSMINSLPMEIHKGFFKLGQRFPEFASYIYIEAKPI